MQMKPIARTLLLLLAFNCTALTFAEEPVATEPAATEPAATEPAAKVFVHPGLLHSSAELAYIRTKIEKDEEPWASAWEGLRRSSSSSLSYTPRPFARVVRGPYNNPNIGSSEILNDSVAAYAHALQWSLTGNQAHADKAIEILNAWSRVLEKVEGHDTKLLIGMMGVRFCNAAELIRHSDGGWKMEDQAQFEKMLRTVFYPPIQDFFPGANGNWDASMIQTMLAMGVFLDDRKMFDRAVDYYKHGKGNGAIENYINEFGECQESGRDQAHTQMGLGFLGCACEMAWKQGVDLYGAADNRLALGFEYTAKYNLGEEVPYEPYRSIDGKYNYRTISSDSRGRFSPIYDRVVVHYHTRKKLEMPYSRKVAEWSQSRDRSRGRSRGRSRNRSSNRSSAHMPWGDLMSVHVPEEFSEREDTP